MTIAPLLLAMASRKAIRRSFGDLRGFDLIDAHYFYPDGVAAALLSHWFDLPAVITARGSDLNLIAKYRLPRHQIKWAIRKVSAVVGVSGALRERLLDLGAAPENVSILRNGVDLDKFRPLDRYALRKELGISRTTLLSVGNLVELKGHDLAIEALTGLSETDLIIVGTGPLRERLREQARRAGVDGRGRFLGAMDQSELLRYYNAADCLVLCSSREGMANVLLESLACGTPVIATRVGGNPEIVTDPAAGLLMSDRTASALVAAVETLLANCPERAATRAFAERFSWSATSEGQLRLFSQVVEARG
jgi:glycosyltransferase involved in cell wall biosynthesis